MDVLTRPPKLRGVIHAAAAPVAVFGTVHLVRSAETTRATVAAFVYGVTAAALYIVSASYHLLSRRGIGRVVLRRADHCTIYFAIAGTMTPLCLLAVEGAWRWLLLAAVWVGAIAGAVIKIVAFDRLTKVGFAMYLLLGWTAAAVLPALARRPGMLIAVLAGGALYTVAAVMFACGWPGRASRWFGFHETWHVNVTAAGVVFYLVNLQLIAQR